MTTMLARLKDLAELAEAQARGARAAYDAEHFKCMTNNLRQMRISPKSRFMYKSSQYEFIELAQSLSGWLCIRCKEVLASGKLSRTVYEINTIALPEIKPIHRLKEPIGQGKK